MSADRGHLRAMRLLPFAAAVGKACLTSMCQDPAAGLINLAKRFGVLS